jgi:hypothetical protein
MSTQSPGNTRDPYDLKCTTPPQTKGRIEIVNTSKVSFTFTSNEVVFSNVEVNFIRKHLHWKYPAAMGDVIDKTRLLMREIQKLAKPNQKLVYSAARYHPNDDSRFVVYEMLGSVESQPNRLLVGVTPVEKERRKDFFDKPSVIQGGALAVVENLKLALKTRSFSKTITPGGIRGNIVLPLLIQFLTDLAEQVTVKDCLLDTSSSNWSFSIDLAHRGSQSHYVKLLFDFVPVNKTEPSAPPETLPDNSLD